MYSCMGEWVGVHLIDRSPLNHHHDTHGSENSFRHDDRPIDPSCGCEACRTYSRSYIHHLLKAGELLGGSLVSLHNVYFMNRLMTAIREVSWIG